MKLFEYTYLNNNQLLDVIDDAEYIEYYFKQQDKHYPLNKKQLKMSLARAIKRDSNDSYCVSRFNDGHMIIYKTDKPARRLARQAHRKNQNTKKGDFQEIL